MSVLNPTSELAIKRDLLRVETRKLLSIVSVSAEWVEALEPNRIAATKMIEDKRIFWMSKAAVRDMASSVNVSITLSAPEKATLIAIIDTIVVDPLGADVDDTYFDDTQRAQVVQAIDDHFDAEYLLLAGETYRASNVPAVIDHINTALGIKTL